MMPNNVKKLIERAHGLVDKLECMMPSKQQTTDWSATAWRWQPNQAGGHLEAVMFTDTVHLDDLHHIAHQKSEIVRNTKQFVRGFTANHVLLTGARGTGKSSIVKAVLNAFIDDGLRLVEVDKQDLVDLPAITAKLHARPEKFIIYCDDLSFETGDIAYKALKVVLDGSIAVNADNILVYATSNRRHLLPEMMADNHATTYVGDEVRPNDSVEEKVSLSDR